MRGVELQFSQVVSAVEVLGALARQSGGTIPDFQKVAAELLAARPGLASLELEPGGVVRDIVPRAGNERAIGLNVLNNPAYRPSASATIQKRALTVTGPLPLYRGDAGIVARVPIFVRGRDGRDAFWGFVAGSMRLSEALARAQVDELATQGYHYAIFAPVSAGRKPVTIAAHGGLSVLEAMQQPVRVQDLEFRLAVEPIGGWFSKTRLVLEGVCVLVVSGLLCLLVNLLESRQAVEASLAEAKRRLERETADRDKAQVEFRSARDEVVTTRAELDRTRIALQSSTTGELRLQAATRAAEELAQALNVELEQVRTAHQQAEQTIASLQARLGAACSAEKEAAPALRTELGAKEGPQEPSGAQVEGDAVAVSGPTESASGTVTLATAEPEPGGQPEPEVTLAAPEPPAAEAPPATKPPRVPRRKKVRRNDQLDLFETPPLVVPSAGGTRFGCRGEGTDGRVCTESRAGAPCAISGNRAAGAGATCGGCNGGNPRGTEAVPQANGRAVVPPVAAATPGKSRAAAQGGKPNPSTVYGQRSRRARLPESQP